MYRKIIVPLDGSELAEQIVPHLARLQPIEKTEIVLVTNIDTNTYVWAAQNYTSSHEFWDMIYKSAEEYLRKQEASLRALGYQVGYRIVKGQTADSIVDLASEMGADLIAMTTHGRTGMARWALGSVADRVIRAAHTPVFLVRSTMEVGDAPTPFKRILVPLDGSQLAEQALPQAVAVAQESGAQVVLMQVLPPLSEMEMDELFEGSESPSAGEDRLISAETYLAQCRRRLASSGAATSGTQIVIGRPAEAILDTAAAVDIDLIVMSTHGRSGYRRMLYGSVAGEVLHGAVCPLLLVRDQQTETARDPNVATHAAAHSTMA